MDDFYSLKNEEVKKIMKANDIFRVTINRHIHNEIFYANLEPIDSAFSDSSKYLNSIRKPEKADAVAYDWATETSIRVDDNDELYIHYQVYDTSGDALNKMGVKCWFTFKLPEVTDNLGNSAPRIRNILLTTLYNDLWKKESRKYEEEMIREKNKAIDVRFRTSVRNALGLQVI